MREKNAYHAYLNFNKEVEDFFKVVEGYELKEGIYYFNKGFSVWDEKHVSIICGENSISTIYFGSLSIKINSVFIEVPKENALELLDIVRPFFHDNKERILDSFVDQTITRLNKKEEKNVLELKDISELRTRS